jgi:hypothetical protein
MNNKIGDPNMPRDLRLSVRAMALTIGIGLAMPFAPAVATVQTFAATSGDFKVPVPDGFAGFNWTDAGGGAIASIDLSTRPVPVELVGFYVGVGCNPPTGQESDCKGVFNKDRAVTTSISRPTEAFNFVTADWTSSLFGQTITLKGYRNGTAQPVYSTEINLLDTQKTSLLLNWVDINQLVIITAGSNANAWVLDNFTYTTAVPEPATVASLLAGLACMVGLQRRIARR